MNVPSRKEIFKVKSVDIEFYEKNLKEFLPDKMIDIHTHVWLDHLVKHHDEELKKVVSWPSKVAKDNSIEDLLETNRLLFPDKDILSLIFSNILDKNNLGPLNQYCSDCAEKHGHQSLAVCRPDWDAEQFESVIRKGRFWGAKVYLTFAPEHIPGDEIEIFDFLPHHQLEVLDQNGWVVMLHIARPLRLRDPVNLAQLLEIENRYPNVKLVVAHVGRAYCIEDVGNAFEILRDTQNMVFDFSANTNKDVFKLLIEAVGPQRILYGSDLPITRMRMKRITENGRYINLVKKGDYGDVSHDPNMREVSPEEAQAFTFFLYEEIDAFRQAAEATGLTGHDIKDVFYNNAEKLLGSIKSTVTKSMS